ncbi:MAG: glycosyltransferase family 2 protein [Bdellovibrionota bacterium]
MPSNKTESLTIVIPAYNEEDAIASTIERCLAARSVLMESLPLHDVEIVVVSDGSTDKTVKIARRYADVKLIEFEKNRGYGTAIKEGFRQGSGTLVSFLDADGTCDPLDFLALCRNLLAQQADLVLGSRMGEGTRMPAIRKLGNRIYALLLGFLCGRKVTDTASGMRVIRRSSLRFLYPLPDGLHFTPSMSSRALLGGLKVLEVPISYEERVGESKLSVFRDGIRFFGTIFSGVLCFRPERFFLMGFMLCVVLTAVLGLYPTEFYLENRWLKDWMIYRFVACFLLGSAGFLFLCATAVAYELSFLGPGDKANPPFWPSLIANFFEGRVLLAFMGVTLLGSVALIFPGIQDLLRDGHVHLHWSRLVVGGFGMLVVFQAAVTHVLIRVTKLYQTETAFQNASPLTSDQKALA